MHASDSVSRPSGLANGLEANVPLRGVSMYADTGEFTPMKHTLILLLGCVGLLVASGVGAQPKPSPYPITWELQFDYLHPKRVVITPPNGGPQQAYWYMTYRVTNTGRQEVNFLPVFHLLTDDGSTIRSDGYRYHKVDGTVQPVMRWVNIGGEVKQGPDIVPANVIDAIRVREKNPHLQAVYEIANTIRLGEDQARDGVAIWPEPDPRMGQFSVLVEGLSGEMTNLTDAKGQPVMRQTKDGAKPIVLRKTMKIDYQMLGDGRTGRDVVEYVGHEWIMR